MKDYTKQVTEIFYTSLKAYVKMSIIAVHFSRLFNAPVVISSSGSNFCSLLLFTKETCSSQYYTILPLGTYEKVRIPFQALQSSQ